MATYPDVNGVRTSYCSIELGLQNRPIPGAKSINYEDSGTIGHVKGTSANIIGRTRGDNESKGDLELYQEEWDEMLPILTRGGAVGYMELSWPMTVCYAEAANLFKTKTDHLVGVRFHSFKKANGESTDGLVVSVQLDIMRIKWHGKFVAVR